MSWLRSGEKILFKTRWHEFKKFDFETEAGAQGEYYYLETPGSVYVLPRDADGIFLMIHSYRCLPDTMSYEFPGGAVHVGKPPEFAAQEELEEEAGVHAESLTHLGTFNPCNGLLQEACHVFLAEDLTAVERHLEATEHMTVIKKTEREIEAMITAGEIFDGQTLAAWALYKARK
ncbi:MAG: hypothetical protein A3C15_01395 [Candidatus Magasanikbacteria bacterium RIFCSPHIGHO2_02_FULL_50_9b]|uniref:Nudix hydrolase domain-containing protein n=1 Tax=Candidatus Magasanikbacteria bacterium RIFCSPHIGHO2_02_FULL_50_9b TaxID=1798682 RepID=A0A1F6M7M6_9BACT|nr:MAG: hypothetical protein A3C15_01395 [Candidatus Magasanikbacteria bacterium RIFCSPHIGHO2_02_FULL_50_9b]